MPPVVTRPPPPLESEAPLAFGPFQLYARQKVLLRRGAPVRLGGRAIDLLLALVRQPGQLLSQRDLVAQVWPHTIVEDSSLRVHVAALRRALRDGADGRCYIGNVPGRGYSFLAQVRAHGDGDGPEPAAPPPARPGAAESAMRLCRIVERVRLTPIVGRGADLAALAERLRANRLVNLVGPGGVGKSTLALALAAGAHEAFPGGVFHIDLGLVHNLEGSSGEIEFIVRTKHDQANANAAAMQHVLLVLDNCEHVAAAAAALAERLLLAMAGLTLLASSREPLQVDGEYLCRLAPLALPPAAYQGGPEPPAYPALQLFLERARKVSHAFELNGENLQLAAAICRRLDGLPLALEIAAAGTATLGLHGVAAQLDGQQLLLERARRGGPAHQESLQASYDWSYRLLSAREQTLFRHLGGYAASFALEAACARAAEVGMTPAQLTRTLMALVSKSLVAADFQAAATRYRLLNTARAYALELPALAAPPNFDEATPLTKAHKTSLD